MKVRVFSVAGEALNFGARRMETIMRVAWLPVSLLMIVYMAAVFASLSVIAGRLITFKDMGTFTNAEKALALFASRGWENDPTAMMTIAIVALGFAFILVASFLAPLIRYAGLGERPPPGLMGLHFGVDQVRFMVASLLSFLLVFLIVLLPASMAGFYVMQYLGEALSQQVASFPNSESLHTIELMTVQEALIAKGASQFYDLGVPLAVAAPMLLVIWLALMFHFQPKNRYTAGPSNIIARSIVTGVLVLAFAGYIFTDVAEIAKANPATGAGVVYVLIAVAALSFLYLGVRLAPYAGVAVCRKSLGLGGTLKVSRGWNFLRLFIILGALLVFFLLVQTYVINAFFLGWLLPNVVLALYNAVAVYTKLLNSGTTGEWVLPLFIWIWNGVKIIINLFWAFFSYGVIAGLYGRLYRESEREEPALDVEAPRGIWRKA